MKTSAARKWVLTPLWSIVLGAMCGLFPTGLREAHSADQPRKLKPPAPGTAQLKPGGQSPSSQPIPQSGTKSTQQQRRIPQQPAIDDLRNRLDKVEAELKELRSGNKAGTDGKRGAPIAAVLELPYLGHTFSYYGPPSGSRFFAGRLIIVNPTSEPITIQAKQIVLRVEQTDHVLKDSLGSLRNLTIHVGGRLVELSKMKPLADLHVPAGGTGSKWVVFLGIPAGVQVPAMSLRVTLPGRVLEINVNEAALRLMGLTVERIGPRKSLALLTISGELNTVNVGSLAGVLDAMVAQKVVRAVIRFTDSAPQLDGQVLSWLQQGAFLAGRGENNNPQMPVFPSALRELHLAAVPNRPVNLEGSAGTAPWIHRNDADAVRAALKTAIEVLPRDELLAEIETGHPLTKLAALAEGGGRLTADDLPLVLKYADDNDPKIELAALAALRHFGERPAIDKLLFYARKNAEPTVSMAIESLAASRYAAAHEALLDILKNEHPASRRLIVRVLAKYPRPIWSETIYSFVRDPEPQVAVEALRALVQTGHPRLFEVLKDSLVRGSPPVREEAFQLLAARNDPQSEELALDFTLETMKHGAPTPAMYGLLGRTKDSRAIPLLLSQLDHATSRSQLISTLAQIGDQSVADALAAKYPGFPDRDKTATLNALQLLKSPHFRRLAGDALGHDETPLVSAAIIGLQNDGSPQAVQLLVQALDSSKNATIWSYITNALGNLGTPESKSALNKAARDAQNVGKQNLAITALAALRHRSPGFPYCLQARQSAQSERWDEAISRYGSAIELDPELADAYSGRGHALLQKKKPAEARKDFTKAVELDPFSAESVTGLGICMVQLGEIEQGIKTIENSRTRMNDDPLYAYNAACVYGRALEHVLTQPASTERDKKADDYRKRSVADLRRCVHLGFREFDWMKKDPDLNSLHKTSDFKKIVAQEASSEDTLLNDDGPDGEKKSAGKPKVGKTPGK